MSTDKHARCGNIAKHSVEHRPISVTLDGIHPYQYTVNPHELPANLITDIVVVEGRLRTHTQLGQRFEHLPEAALLRRCALPCFAISRTKDRHSMCLFVAHDSVPASRARQYPYRAS